MHAKLAKTQDKHAVNFCAKNVIYPLTMNNRLYSQTAYSSVQHQYHTGGKKPNCPQFYKYNKHRMFLCAFQKKKKIKKA
jgi:hypothetical protein